MKDRFQRFLKKLKETIKQPEMRILPGQLAFFLLLSIIPLFAVIGVIAARFNISLQTLITSLSNNLPEEVSDFIINITGGRNINMNIVIFCISGFILASNGPHSMIIGSNLLYKIENKDFLTRRVKALLMCIILVILFLFILVVPAFGDQIIHLIKEKSELNIDKTVSIVYSVLKYPVSIFIIFFFIKLLYVMAPDIKIPSNTTTLGALFTTLGWIVSTEIYSFYVKKFAYYNILYGSVANLIILFLWIYILSYIFMVGMALNATNYNESIDKG